MKSTQKSLESLFKYNTQTEFVTTSTFKKYSLPARMMFHRSSKLNKLTVF